MCVWLCGNKGYWNVCVGKRMVMEVWCVMVCVWCVLGWCGGGSVWVSRRRRNAKARRAVNCDDVVMYECVDGEMYCDGCYVCVFGCVCVVFWMRCFYEFEREEIFTYDFSYDEDDDSAVYFRVWLWWWEDWIVSEMLWELMMC